MSIKLPVEILNQIFNELKIIEKPRITICRYIILTLDMDNIFLGVADYIDPINTSSAKTLNDWLNIAVDELLRGVPGQITYEAVEERLDVGMRTVYYPDPSLMSDLPYGDGYFDMVDEIRSMIIERIFPE